LSRPDDEVLGKAYDARLMARLWAVTRPHQRLVLLSLVLFPLTAGVELVGPYLVKLAIDQHILVGDWAGLGGMAILFLLTLGALYLLRVAQAYVTQLTGQRVMHDLRHALFAHLQRLDAGFFDRNPVGRLMTRVLTDAEAINEMFTSGTVAIVGDVVTLTGVVIVLLLLNWKLALVTFALVPVLAVAAAYFRIKARDCYRVVRVRLAALSAFLQESIQGMTVIQLFARERPEAASFARLNGGLREAQFRSTIYDASLYAIVEAMGSAAVALLLWYGGGEVLAGALTFGGLVAFIEYTSRFFLPIRDLGAKYAVMQAAMVSAERVFGLLDTPPAVVGGRHRGGTRGTARPAVEFREVAFAYAGGPFVLRECSFRIGAGERVALVGPTGEGKTTVARLMTRTYDVAAGQVLVDGVDVREWDLHALRRHVGLVPQEPFLFTGTIRENLALGDDGGSADGRAAALEAALARAQATRLVAGMPGGLDAIVRERGVNLSQGQRQLLAIARALIYNPRVLALDEATSSVDAESETLIRAAVAELLQDRASLIIAHRLSTIQSADRILVLHRGRVREAGRHAELLAVGGIYARLYEMQFGREPA
jgi:ATP-binding cassette subfamily B multidrug efflux pump